MNSRRIIMIFLWGMVSFYASFNSANTFLYNIKHCYCNADWICKDFENMSLPEFINAWQQLVELITHPARCHFYGYDFKVQYEERLRQQYSNFERYDRESIDTEWLRECRQYHQFLVTYYFDTKRDVIRKKEQKTGKRPLRLRKRYIQMQKLVAQRAPQSHFEFYRFFFERLANVMLKKLNYIYHEDESSLDHVMQLLEHKLLMTRIYRTCLHETKQASATYAYKMAYHYNRIESVLEMVFSEWLKRIDL